MGVCVIFAQRRFANCSLENAVTPKRRILSLTIIALLQQGILTLVLLAFVCVATGEAMADVKKIAFFANITDADGNIRKPSAKPPRYPKPALYGKTLDTRLYKGLMLVGADPSVRGVPSNQDFFDKVIDAVDLIDERAPELFNIMTTINPKGRRIVFYTGEIGPASFAAWDGDFVVNIPATAIDEDPVFENTVYSLAATLVHELVGHGRQESDGRIWPMYDWCGQDAKDVEGVVWQANHIGASSGFVEYEANLYARWFLEKVRGSYPDLNEPAVRRYVKTVRMIKMRFPGWYDERKQTTTLLSEFEDHFNSVCRNLKFTPHRFEDR